MKNHLLKIYLGLSILFLGLVSLGFWYVYKDIKQNNAEAEKILLEWQREAARREEIKSLNRSVKEIEPEKILLDTHFAKSSDVVPFLDTLEKLGRDAKTKAEITSVEVSKDNDFLVLDIRATGLFDGVYKFVKLLESSPYELEFIYMDLQAAGGQDVPFKPVKSREWQVVLKIKLLSFEGAK